MSGTMGGANPEGHGTHAGGGPDVRKNPKPCPTPSVTNQPILPLEGNLFANLDQRAAQDVVIVQLAFARDVSRLAADAYQRVLTVLEEQGRE